MLSHASLSSPRAPRGGKGEAHSGSVGPQVTFNRRALETCFSSFPSHPLTCTSYKTPKILDRNARGHTRFRVVRGLRGFALRCCWRSLVLAQTASPASCTSLPTSTSSSDTHDDIRVYVGGLADVGKGRGGGGEALRRALQSTEEAGKAGEQWAGITRMPQAGLLLLLFLAI